MKKKQILATKAAPYSLINGFLYKMGLDDLLRRCVLEHERDNIMYEAHYGPTGGHLSRHNCQKNPTIRAMVVDTIQGLQKGC